MNNALSVGLQLQDQHVTRRVKPETLTYNNIDYDPISTDIVIESMNIFKP